MASPSAAKTAQRVLSVDEALERILARIAALAPETIALGDALGCVLAEDVVADRDVPPFRNSAMDGYAVRGEDVARPSVRLRVVGAVGAGETPARAVGRGAAAPSPRRAARSSSSTRRSRRGRSATRIATRSRPRCARSAPSLTRSASRAIPPRTYGTRSGTPRSPTRW